MRRKHTTGAEAKNDSGFTLVEMMVTLIVIAILVAIAIPTFLSARERASNRSAQARANTGLKAHKAELADNPDIEAMSAGDLTLKLEDLEPSVTFDTVPPTGTYVKGVVYV